MDNNFIKRTEDVSVPPRPIQPQPTNQATQSVVSSAKPKKSKKIIVVVAIIMALLIGGLLAYLWQQREINEAERSQTSLKAEVDTLKSKLSASDKALTEATEEAAESESILVPPVETGTATPNYNVVTGTLYAKAVGTASIDLLYKPGKVTALWIEYGMTPEKLNLTTKQVTEGLGEGSSGYGNQGFVLTGLATGTRYFYRAAATSDGKTIYGGLASFSSDK